MMAAGEIAKLTTPHLDSMAAEAMTASGRRAAREILRKRERAITAAMRDYLALEPWITVKLRRPGWMPRRVYGWIMRTIVFEERATR
jgi:hypothetical protein